MASEGALKAAREIHAQMYRWDGFSGHANVNQCHKCMAPAPSPGVMSEQVGRCEKCGSSDPAEKWCMYKSHTAKGNFTRVNPSNPFCVECDNKSFHNPVSRPKTCPDCGSSDPKVRLTSRPINRVFDLGYIECDNKLFHSASGREKGGLG